MAWITLAPSGRLRFWSPFAADIRQRYSDDFARQISAIRERGQNFRRDWGRLTPAERTDAIHRLLPHIVSIAAIAGIVYQVARLGTVLFLPVERTAWRPPPLPAMAGTTAADYSTIQAAHLFGTAAAVDTPVADMTDVPATALSLELRAVVASSDERFAHVIVGDGSGQDEIYFLRSTLPGGALVASILPDRVILNRDGQLEALILPRTRDPNSLNTERGVWASGDSLIQADAAPPAMAEAQPTARPARLADIMMPRPRVRQGEFQGVEVFPGEHAEQFTALGLLPGDLIVAIDGRALTLNDAAAPFQGIAGSADLTVTIQRRGQKKTIRIVKGQSATKT